MRLNRILRRQKGFTLLETMIAMAVLSFGVLSLASFYTQGLRSSDQVQMQYIANQKAQQALETIFTARDTQLLSFSQLNNVSQGVFSRMVRSHSGRQGPMGSSEPPTTIQPIRTSSLPGRDPMEFLARQTTPMFP